MTSTANPYLHVALRRRQVLAVIGAYVALTKPRIIELLLVTTVPAMLLAGRSLPSIGLLATTLIGGALAAGSANALNCYLDRDIDSIMHRTANRPLSRSAVSPTSALIFGLILGAVSVIEFWITANWLSAVLAFGAIAFYVLIYTALLKRRTSSNIVWGGAAGCMPVLIGWSAVTGSLAWAPFVLFGIVFLWTPPHFWALAMQFREDYAAANVPMLPVVASPAFVAGRIATYSCAMVTVSLLLWPVAHLNAVYPVLAAVLGGLFLREAFGMRSRVLSGADIQPMRLFHWSITYLSLLFLTVAVTALW
ncbi:MAG: protoheme IX farnesyltransferase [Pseudonocardiales bacterium]|nr:MAG: protoheme IX farnesyltransferase [Pseudonocardiales bacterium]